jgi:hypothetical protein
MSAAVMPCEGLTAGREFGKIGIRGCSLASRRKERRITFPRQATVRASRATVLIIGCLEVERSTSFFLFTNSTSPSETLVVPYLSSFREWFICQIPIIRPNTTPRTSFLIPALAFPPITFHNSIPLERYWVGPLERILYPYVRSPQSGYMRLIFRLGVYTPPELWAMPWVYKRIFGWPIHVVIFLGILVCRRMSQIGARMSHMKVRCQLVPAPNHHLVRKS